MTVSDAISLIRWETTNESATVNLRELLEAGLVLVRHTAQQAQELERERARGASRTRGARVEGYPLVEGADGGGIRHFLGGTAVHAGSALYLLTFAGWLPGRYEWNWRCGTPPNFCFSLPGVLSEVAIPILPGARLAWPDEVEAAAS